MLEDRQQGLYVEKHHLSNDAIGDACEVTASFDIKALLLYIIGFPLQSRHICNPLLLILGF